jgi:DNA-binding CsgD family transcriptional regulator
MTTAASAALQATHVLERQDELEVISGRLRAAAAGHGSIVLLEGPPGIGKTTLLTEARAQAVADGVRPLAARGSDLERDFAYGVVRQLLEPTVFAGADGSGDDLLSGAAALAGPVLGAASADEPPPTSFTVLHGLYWLCANLAQRQPLLLSVDDVHWADASSLRFLVYLARRLDELPIVLLLAAHDVEPEGGALAQLMADPHLEVLTPGPLSVNAVAVLLGEELGRDPDEQFALACHAATGGVPFLIRELTAALNDDGIEPTAQAAARVRELRPRTIARSVLMRLGRFAPPARELARTIAVLGGGAELRHAAVLAGLSQDLAAETADQLAVAGILVRGRPLAFVHPIVQAAVYGDMGQGDRSRRHAEAARLLTLDHAQPEQIAAHLLAAEPAADPAVIEVLRAAALEAAARGSLDSAVAYLRRALAEPPRPEARVALLLELGSAETHIGDESAIEHLEEAFGSAGDPQLLADAALQLGRALVLSDQLTRAAETFDRAVAAFAGTDPELELLFESGVVGAAEIDLATAPLLAGRVERLRRLARRAPSVPRAVHSVLAYAAAASGASAADAVESAERALDGIPRPYPGAGDPHLFFYACTALLLAEQFDRVRPFYDAALQDAQRAGSVPRFAAASTFRSWLSYRVGDLDEAEADARLAVEACTEHGLEWYLPYSVAMLLETLVERGDLERAEEELARSGAADEERTSLSFTMLLYARGRLRSAQGRAEEAGADLLAAGTRLALMQSAGPAVCAWRSEAALVEAAHGAHDEARRLVEAELELARSFGAPRALGVALRAAGVVAMGDEGLTLLAEAVSVLEASQARLEQARALTELGSALRRNGRRKEARTRLLLALDLAHRCGATALAERAREELVAAGARPRRALLSGVEALTPSEARIVRMAADGLANREIAQALFVTARTVETHLTHAYQKLGISSREELPAALAERP